MAPRSRGPPRASASRLKARAIVTHRLWDVRAPGSAPDDIENGCGLTDLQGRRKPAFAALLRLRR